MTNYLPIEIDRVYAITLNPPSKFELGDSNDKELKKNSKKRKLMETSVIEFSQNILCKL